MVSEESPHELESSDESVSALLVLACARPALHRPAPSCTALQDSLTTVNHSICRPLGGTMMAHGGAYIAT